MIGYSKLDKVYQDSSLGFAKKSKILFTILGLFTIIMFLFATLDLFSQKYTDAFSELMIFISCAIGIYFIFKGNYKVASSIATVSSIFFLSTMIVFSTKVESGQIIWSAPNSLNSMLLYFLYVTPVFCMLFLTSYSRWQPIFSGVTSILFTLVIYLIIFVNNRELAISSETIIVMGTIIVVEFLSNLFSYMTMKLTNDVISNLESQLEINNQRLQKMHSLLMTAHKGLSMGQNLSVSSGNSVKLINATRNELDLMNTVIDSLGEIAQESIKILSDIKVASSNVKDNMTKQGITVSESTASIEEMTAAISSIAASAEQKKHLVEEVSAEASKSAEDLSSALSAIEKISVSSEGLLKVVGVIEDIAGRTNLLAMNASIEAAHAGSAGKGFAVVASEIRTLAEEANQNSKKIRQILDENINNIKQTSEVSKTALINLGAVTSDIQQVSTVIREVLDGARELSAAAKVVNLNSQDLVNISNDVGDSIDSVDTLIVENYKYIDRLNSSCTKADRVVKNILRDSEDLLLEIQQVDKLGKSNIDNIKELENSLQ
ncbi:MAG: hypothetical protein JXR63_04955 [Spirochaetales bacterium]|nr:hypothetical protein [Spirochaetales bacterium]